MKFGIIGVNHRTTPLVLRERFALSPEQQPPALSQLRQLSGIDEVLLISTCNRTEIYYWGDAEPLTSWLSQLSQLDPSELLPLLYRHTNQDAIRHLIRVASGLDSLILGEPQILGQLKQAFDLAQQHQSLGPWLHRLWQQGLNAAKRVRTETDIGSHAVSVAFAGVNLARHIFDDLSQTRALLIGAGETIELAARHLRQHGVQRMIVANRTLERAQTLAGEFQAEAIRLEAIPSILAQIDLVVSSTASPLPLIGKGLVEQAIKKRRHQPMLFIDLAVPRDIEAEVGDIDEVYLYDMDALQQLVSQNRQQREQAAVAAEQLIEHILLQVSDWQHGLTAIQPIRQLRNQAQQLTETTLNEALSALKQGKSAESVLQRYLPLLANRLLHQPTSALRHAAEQQRSDLLAAANELFSLKQEDADNP